MEDVWIDNVLSLVPEAVKVSFTLFTSIDINYLNKQKQNNNKTYWCQNKHSN